jgi:hypothetical protein
MEIKKGTFILEEWKNHNGYRSTWVRQLDRETKTQFISYPNRSMKPRVSGIRNFSNHSCTRYRKTDTSIKPINTMLSNPDGNIELSVVSDFSKLTCRYSYTDLFQTDLRILQKDLDVTPLTTLQNRIDKGWYEGSTTFNEEKHFQLEKHIRNVSDETDHWNRPLIDYLESLFNVPVFFISENVREHNEQSKLTESIIYMHVNHFGSKENKDITSDDSYHNRTIGFWLFNDKLVFQYEGGKENW